MSLLQTGGLKSALLFVIHVARWHTCIASVAAASLTRLASWAWSATFEVIVVHWLQVYTMYRLSLTCQ